MTLQALLVSKDEPTAETLIQVLTQFGVAVDRSNDADVAVARLLEERFDQVIVDFDDPQAASPLLEACRGLVGPDRKPPVTVALLHDASQIRSILGAGTHFILTKPITPEQAQTTLRAATAMLKRERRQSVADRRPGRGLDSYRRQQYGRRHPARPEHRRHGCADGQATFIRDPGSRFLPASRGWCWYRRRCGSCLEYR